MPNAPRQHRQYRGRMNGHMIPQGGAYIPHLQQPTQLPHTAKDSNNQQACFLLLQVFVIVVCITTLYITRTTYTFQCLTNLLSEHWYWLLLGFIKKLIRNKKPTSYLGLRWMFVSPAFKYAWCVRYSWNSNSLNDIHCSGWGRLSMLLMSVNATWIKESRLLLPILLELGFNQRCWVACLLLLLLSSRNRYLANSSTHSSINKRWCFHHIDV